MGKTHTIEEYGTVIYKCYAGSRSYGTNIDEAAARQLAKERGGDWTDYVSDVDIRGIFIPHRHLLLSEHPVQEFRDPSDEDTVYFSLSRFLELAIDCNPNIVEQLFVREEDVLYINEVGEELRALRHLFVSKNAFGRFGSYAFSQLKRMDVHNSDFRRNEKRMKAIEFGDEHFDRKNAMHLVRLLKMGIEILRDGDVKTYRPDAEFLLSIRHGSLSRQEILDLAADLEAELEDAMQNSTIPNVPNQLLIHQWLIKVTDQTLGLEQLRALPATTDRLLPPVYSMAEDCTLCLIGAPLVRKQSNSNAHGLVLPYKDWFTGLYTFDTLKFEETTLEHFDKFAHQVEKGNPKHIDMLFAPPTAFLRKHPMTGELFEQLKGLLTTKRLFSTANGFLIGNFRKMQEWEKAKAEWSAYKDAIASAKSQTKEEWASKFEALQQNEARTLEQRRKDYDQLLKDYHTWQGLCGKKGNLSYLPPIPAGTPNEHASAMGKFEYDTLLASQLYQVTQLYAELFRTGTIQDSRAYEKEMYAIKHGKYKTFEAFEEAFKVWEEAFKKSHTVSVLPANPNRKQFDSFRVDFIERFLSQLP